MRLFVAVDFPPAVREALWTETTPLREATTRVKWVPPALMHVTLKFLGERDPGEVAGLVEGLRRAAVGGSPVRTRIGGIGAFPNFRRPRVVWVGVDDVGALGRLATRIDGEYAALGLEREARPFVPHLTLGRAKGEATSQELSALRLAADRVRGTHDAIIDRVSLVHSTLGPAGPTYRELESIPLEGGIV